MLLGNFDNQERVRNFLSRWSLSPHKIISLLAIKGISRNIRKEEAGVLLEFLSTIDPDDERHLYFLNGVIKNEIKFMIVFK